MNNITLRQLKTFALIVEQGSFARCAEFLDVSPVAVSEHVKKLEARLRHQIFERQPGEVTILTEAGEHDYQLVKTILSTVDVLLGDSNELGGEAQRICLNLTMEPFIFNGMQKEISILKNMYPDLDINFELDAVSPSNIERQLRDNKTDIAYFYALEGEGDLESEFICYEPLAIYVGEEHPLASKELVNITDLEAISSIQPSKKNYLNKLFRQAMDRIGLKNISIALQSDSLGIVFPGLHKNLGFSCMCQGVEASEYAAKLKRLNFEHELPRLEIRQVIRPSLQGNLFIQNAAQQLISTISSK